MGYFPTSALILVLLAGLFYPEENWRGRRAWESCKLDLAANGAKLDWTNYIPAPVPDDQNIFAVPEMQEWFAGEGPNGLSEKLVYSGDDWNSRTARVTVAELRIVLPGAAGPGPGSG